MHAVDRHDLCGLSLLSMSRRTFAELWLSIPDPVKAEITSQLKAGSFFFLSAAGLLMLSPELFLVIAPTLLGISLLSGACVLFLRCASGEILALYGECLEVSGTSARSKSRYALCAFSGQEVKIRLRSKRELPRPGDRICLYLPAAATVYLQGNLLTVTQYIAIQVCAGTEI